MVLAVILLRKLRSTLGLPKFAEASPKPPLGGSLGLSSLSRCKSPLKRTLTGASISRPTLQALAVWRRVRRGGG